MARTGGRSLWIAVPAGLACAVVVAGLAYLALPMVPVTIGWMGDTLRAATTADAPETDAETPAAVARQSDSLDCRAIYPGDLWSELMRRRGSLLDQGSDPPATAAVSLVDAIAPTVRVSCAWAFDGGASVVTTLSRVGDDASAIAEAALRGQGFECALVGEALHCRRAQGDVLEEHTLASGLWLASIETGWNPDDYGARLDAHLWG
jgi:hypothetical protein